jgi:hypothetical protein
MPGVLLIPPAYGSLPVSKREASVQDIAHPYGSHVHDLEKGTLHPSLPMGSMCSG